MVWYRPEDAQAWIKHLEGKEVAVEIRRYRPKRSINQNAYYHGVVIPWLAEAMGEEGEDGHERVHQALKIQFLMDRSGKLPTVRSTASLDTAEFTEYIEQCRRLAAEMFGLNIPDPLTAASMELVRT